MESYFKSWFNYGDISWGAVAVSVGLGLAFGIIWLIAHWPALLKSRWLWFSMVAGAFITLLAVTFVQTPLTYYANQGMQHIWSTATLSTWQYLDGLVTLIINGLVQAGALMLPAVFYWLRSGKQIDPKVAFDIGVVAGAGYGIFQAIVTHAQALQGGWSFSTVTGIDSYLPFWDSFWMIPIFIAMAALASYGLAKNKGWKFYLLSAGMLVVANYFFIAYAKGNFSFRQAEICMGGVAAILAVFTLYERWHSFLEDNGADDDEDDVPEDAGS